MFLIPGVIPNYKTGPTSWPVTGYNGVGTPTTITGGQLVIPNTGTAAGTMVTPAGALAVTCIGVAANDGAAPRSSQDSQNPAVLSQQPDIVAVHYGVDIDVTYTTNVLAGALIVCAAAGAVQDAAANVFGTIIGRCTQPGGVIFGTNPIGSARIAGVI